jgi:hypothetical protein
LEQLEAFHHPATLLVMLTLLPQIIIFIFGQALFGQMLVNLLDQQAQPVLQDLREQQALFPALRVQLDQREQQALHLLCLQQFQDLQALRALRVTQVNLQRQQLLQLVVQQETLGLTHKMQKRTFTLAELL